jgi:hypothetical protein
MIVAIKHFSLSCNFIFDYIVNTMPQFKPMWWVNLISWSMAILSLMTWVHQAISFPNLLRIKLSRALMLFYF